MVEPGRHTLDEIRSQPQVWQDAIGIIQGSTPRLAEWWADGAFDQVVFTGCGSTYYLAELGATLLRSLASLPTWAFPASELLFDPNAVFRPETKTLLVAVSRSGETSETVRAARAFQGRGNGRVLTVTCYSESALAQDADLLLSIDTAREESIAQTRSFSSMAVVVQSLAALIAGHEISQGLSIMPQVCAQLLSDQTDLARLKGEDRRIERFFFLGSGPLYGVACEAMLKMKEMSLSYSEGYHTLEFRHGPMSMVNDQALVVGLLSEGNERYEVPVLREMRDRGAQVVAMGIPSSLQGLDDVASLVPIDAGVVAWARPILYLPVLQLMAYYRALLNNQNPDRPENLSAVISLQDLDWGS